MDNWLAILLIFFAVIFFIIEATTPGFGVWFTAGLISAILGILIWTNPGMPWVIYLQINPWAVVLIFLALAAIGIFIVQLIWKAHKRRVATGYEDIVGHAAEVRTDLNPEGLVFLEGELWTAVSESGQIKAGEEVKVSRVDGLKLFVVKK